MGSNKAPPLPGLNLEADYIATRIRTSGLPSSPVYEGLTGGRMPFWGVDRIDDAQLRDLVAYVVELQSAEPPPPASPRASASAPADERL